MAMPGTITNILTKVIALLLAILLWFNVVSKKQYEADLTLPVTEVDCPPGLTPVTGVPRSLAVKVMAEGRKLLRSDWKEAGLRIKATRMRRGVNTLELNLETVSLLRSERVTLIELPGAGPISIQLDRIDTLAKPIASRLVVRSAAGSSTLPAPPRLVPSRTRVIGPSALIEAIDSIYTESRTINFGADTVRLKLKLIPPAGRAVRLENDSVTVTLTPERLTSKPCHNLPVALEADPQDRSITAISDRVTVEVRGPQRMIDTRSSPSLLAQARNNGAATAASRKVDVSCPSSRLISRVRPDSVRILVNQ